MADFTIKRGDRSPSIAATLDAAAGALTSCTVKFIMTSQVTGVVTVDANAVIVDANARTVRYDWAANDTATAGHYDAEWEVTYPGSPALSATFPSDAHLDIYVVPDLA